MRNLKHRPNKKKDEKKKKAAENQTTYKCTSTQQNNDKIKLSKTDDLLVISLPELYRSDVGRDKYGTTQERVEGGGKQGRHSSLEKQHGRIWIQLRNNWMDITLSDESALSSSIGCLVFGGMGGLCTLLHTGLSTVTVSSRWNKGMLGWDRKNSKITLQNVSHRIKVVRRKTLSSMWSSLQGYVAHWMAEQRHGRLSPTWSARARCRW